MAIQSVSAWPEKRDEIRRMMEVAAADIKQLGGSVELVDIGTQKVGRMGAFLGGSVELLGIRTQKVGGEAGRGLSWAALWSLWASGPRRWALGLDGSFIEGLAGPHKF